MQVKIGDLVDITVEVVNVRDNSGIDIKLPDTPFTEAPRTMYNIKSSRVLKIHERPFHVGDRAYLDVQSSIKYTILSEVCDEMIFVKPDDGSKPYAARAERLRRFSESD